MKITAWSLVILSSVYWCSSNLAAMEFAETNEFDNLWSNETFFYAFDDFLTVEDSALSPEEEAEVLHPIVERAQRIAERALNIADDEPDFKEEALRLAERALQIALPEQHPNNIDDEEKTAAPTNIQPAKKRLKGSRQTVVATSMADEDDSEDDNFVLAEPGINKKRKRLGSKNEKALTVRSFECKICAKTFTRRDSLTKHLRLHVEPKKTFSCTECSVVALTVAHLKRHVLHEHGEEFRFRCTADNCTRSFKKECHLTRHHDEVHSGKEFSCRTCLSVFGSESSCARHQKDFRH